MDVDATADVVDSSVTAQMLIENLEEFALFVVEASGRIASWNPGVKVLLGYDRAEFIGRDVKAVISSADESADAPGFRWLRRRDLSMVWCQGSVSAVRADTGVVGYVYAYHDASDARRLGCAIGDAGRQKDRFLASVSHELRTPLMAILGWIRVMQDGGLDGDEMRSALTTIERNAMMQRRLIEDLIDCARLLDGSLEIVRSETDMTVLVHDVVEEARVVAEEKEIRIEASVDNRALVANVDGDRLRQVLSNVLSNAIKFTLDGGAITISLALDVAEMRLAVHDTGVGIEPDLLPHLFDAFRHGSDDRPFAESGVGLGLCVAREVVELHGGTITASSEGLGRGATFEIRIPM